MGYLRGALRLEWPEDSEFSGLEVRMRRLSIKQLMRVEKLSDLRKDPNADVETVVGELLDQVGKGLLSWNLEDEIVNEDTGEISTVPVPATRAALEDRDLDMIMTLVRAWTKAAAGIPLASPPSSPTGEPVPPDDEWASYLATNQQSLPAPVSS